MKNFVQDGCNVYFFVKVTPKSHQNKIIGWQDDKLKMTVRAPPEKGKANAEVIRLLAEQFDLPKSRIEILSGLGSHIKRICVHHVTVEELCLKK